MSLLDVIANGPSHNARAIGWLVAVAGVTIGFAADLPVLVLVGAIAFWLSLWWVIRARALRRSGPPGPADPA